MITAADDDRQYRISCVRPLRLVVVPVGGFEAGRIIVTLEILDMAITMQREAGRPDSGAVFVAHADRLLQLNLQLIAPREFAHDLGDRDQHVILGVTPTQRSHYIPLLGVVDRNEAVGVTEGEDVEISDQHAIKLDGITAAAASFNRHITETLVRAREYGIALIAGKAGKQIHGLCCWYW